MTSLSDLLRLWVCGSPKVGVSYSPGFLVGQLSNPNYPGV